MKTFKTEIGEFIAIPVPMGVTTFEEYRKIVDAKDEIIGLTTDIPNYEELARKIVGTKKQFRRSFETLVRDNKMNDTIYLIIKKIWI